MTQHFASDNNAGICPEAMAALKRANATGHELSYGGDRWTAAGCDGLRTLFQTDCEVFFVFNGTAANSLSIASLCQSYHSVLCHELAHVETSECGAPEFFANGSKVLLLRGALSDILAPATVERMRRAAPSLQYAEIPGVGHAPMLSEPEALEALRGFFEGVS